MTRSKLVYLIQTKNGEYVSWDINNGGDLTFYLTKDIDRASKYDIEEINKTIKVLVNRLMFDVEYVDHEEYILGQTYTSKDIIPFNVVPYIDNEVESSVTSQENPFEVSETDIEEFK